MMLNSPVSPSSPPPPACATSADSRLLNNLRQGDRHNYTRCLVEQSVSYLQQHMMQPSNSIKRSPSKWRVTLTSRRAMLLVLLGKA